MSLVFPSSPYVGQQTFTGTKTFEWDGERWNIVATPAIGYTGSFNPILPVTFSNTVTFKGSSTATPAVFYGAVEYANVSATAATGTINFNIYDQPILYYTGSATTTFNLNFRYTSTIPLNTAMANNQVIQAVFMNTNGALGAYPVSILIDGYARFVKWQGGYAPIGGYPYSVDVYLFSIIKTNANAYTIFATTTPYA